MVLPHLGALRYHATLVPTGTRAALLALVGGGEVRVAPLDEEGTPTLFIEGNEGDIANAAGSGGAGTIVLCLLIGLPAALGLWLKARAMEPDVSLSWPQRALSWLEGALCATVFSPVGKGFMPPCRILFLIFDMKRRRRVMKLICLGINGPFPAAEGATSGYLVTSGDTRLMLDMGSGTLAALTGLMPPEGLTAVLLSHWHFDHCSDMMPLIYRMESLLASGVQPLAVYGPADGCSPVRHALEDSPGFHLHTVAPGDRLTLDGVEVLVGPARHPVPAVGYRLAAEGRSLCYTGDTNEVDGLDDFARGTTLLLADGLFPEAVWTAQKPHLSARRAALLAREAGAQRLMITHLHPSIDPSTLLEEARAVRPDAVLAQRLGVTEL